MEETKKGGSRKYPPYFFPYLVADKSKDTHLKPHLAQRHMT